LWFNYLKEARDYIKQYSVNDRRYNVINELHERALVFMNKMPRIWIDYCQFLIEQRLITKTRHTFDNALMSLPVTQHDKIWEYYATWIETVPSPLSVIKVYKRYIRFNPDAREDYVEYLLSTKLYEQAVLAIKELLNDDMFYSKRKRSKFDYWIIMCDIISKYPDEVANIDCEKIIRYGLNKYTDEVGRLWVALCNFYIRQGLFEKARDIFEEALSKVTTARDFSLVFNSYLKFEEEIVNHLIEEDDEMDGGDDELDDLINSTLDQLGIDKKDTYVNLKEKESEINLKLFRISNLIERRPFLLSDAMLRQNPNNVKEWLKRIKLCKEDKELLILTYERAISTVEPVKAYGRPEQLWINYAKFYESIDDIKNANKVFYIGTKAIFKSVDQIASIWCEWAEMHLRLRNYYDALEIVKRACTTRRKDEGKLGPSVSHSLKIWSMYVDLEEELGSVEQVRVRIIFI
jgi:pre-mRNA-splicing factor SYF1